MRQWLDLYKNALLAILRKEVLDNVAPRAEYPAIFDKIANSMIFSFWLCCRKAVLNDRQKGDNK